MRRGSKLGSRISFERDFLGGNEFPRRHDERAWQSPRVLVDIDLFGINKLVVLGADGWAGTARNQVVLRVEEIEKLRPVQTRDLLIPIKDTFK